MGSPEEDQRGREILMLDRCCQHHLVQINCGPIEIMLSELEMDDWFHNLSVCLDILI